MKKMTLFLTLMLPICLLAAASAEAPRLETGVITALDAGIVYDLDGDGEADEARLTIPDDDRETYTLRVGTQQADGVGCDLNDSLFALRLTPYGGALIMVSENGPSDDYLTYLYLYEDGELIPVGTIGALPGEMSVRGSVITAPVRAKVLYTWFHEADFSLARGFSWDEEGNMRLLPPTIYGIPRDLYSMGLIVTLKVDLPLYAARADRDYAAALPAGTRAVLCASDDVKWVYIQAVGAEEAGWMELSGESGIDCLVNGVPLHGWDVFDGLWYAD